VRSTVAQNGARRSGSHSGSACAAISHTTNEDDTMKVTVLDQPHAISATIPGAAGMAPSPVPQMAPTPTQQIVNRANKTASVVDERGRKITVKKLSALDRVRMLSIAGSERSTNEALMPMIWLTFAVSAIDDEPMPKPNNWRELEVQISLLDDSGIVAAAEAYVLLSPPQDDDTVTQVKN
jgi:hypothetical protein